MPKATKEQTQAKNAPNSEYERLSTTEFRTITLWAAKLIFSVSKLDTIIYAVTASLSKLMFLAWAYLFGRILDWVINAAQTGAYSTNDLQKIFVVMLVYGCIETVTVFFMYKSLTTLQQKSPPRIREAYLRKLHLLGMQTLEQPEINNKMSRANDYLGSLVDYYIQLIDIIADLVKFVAALVIIFKGYPIVAILVVVIKIPSVLVDKSMRRKIWRFWYENTTNRRLAGESAQNLSTATQLAEITIINGFDYLLDKYVQFQDWYANTNIKIQARWRYYSHSLGIFSDIVTYGSYVYFFSKVLQGIISVGDVTFAIRAMGSLQDSFVNVTRSMNQLIEKALQYKDVHALFVLEPTFSDGELKINKLEKGPKISFRNVSFKYSNSERYVLENLNLTINSGEKIAIVGHNGAGKTTLAKLITRFYKTTEGEICINDIDIHKIESASLYANYGVLWQDYTTYAQLTVEENICIGDTSFPFDKKRMLNAAQAADALGFVNEYPKNFDTILSEKYKEGIRPSTGQWQKIAIARFFYRNAPLLIFDEPTASIDAKSEYNIFQNIYNFFTNKTVIIISHRFSTVRNADRILVMEHGKIVEDGAHDELMLLGGKYAEAFKLQAEGYKERVAEIV